MAGTPTPVDPDLGNEAPAPSVKGNMFSLTKVCGRCRLPFKEEDTVTFRGKVYGVPCGCSRDIEKLVQGRK
jgi:hypothetical protein